MTLRQLIDALLDYDLSTSMHTLLATAEKIFIFGAAFLVPFLVAYGLVNQYTKEQYPDSYDEKGNASWAMSAISILLSLAVALTVFVASIKLFF